MASGRASRSRSAHTTRRFTGFDDKVIAPYARGLTVCEIQAFLKETYAVEVSPDPISAVADAIVAEVTAWHSRPLALYPVVLFDALRTKIRDEATVRIKAEYLAAGRAAGGQPRHARHLDRAHRGLHESAHTHRHSTRSTHKNSGHCDLTPNLPEPI
jgi:hypothetical protein